jgi:hypothetical protein
VVAPNIICTMSSPALAACSHSHSITTGSYVAHHSRSSSLDGLEGAIEQNENACSTPLSSATAADRCTKK